MYEHLILPIPPSTSAAQRPCFHLLLCSLLAPGAAAQPGMATNSGVEWLAPGCQEGSGFIPKRAHSVSGACSQSGQIPFPFAAATCQAEILNLSHLACSQIPRPNTRIRRTPLHLPYQGEGLPRSHEKMFFCYLGVLTTSLDLYCFVPFFFFLPLNKPNAFISLQFGDTQWQLLSVSFPVLCIFLLKPLLEIKYYTTNILPQSLSPAPKSADISCAWGYKKDPANPSQSIALIAALCLQVTCLFAPKEMRGQPFTLPHNNRFWRVFPKT